MTISGSHRNAALAVVVLAVATAAVGWWSLRAMRPYALPGAEREIYRDVGGRNLALHVFHPPSGAESRTAVIFFHGGGWVHGSPEELAPHCARLASRGVVAIAAEYRLVVRGATTPADAVEDAYEAFRYVVAEADRLGVDPGRVVLLGGSAGAHLAAMAALRSIAGGGPRPAAVILLSGVLDTTERGYGHELFGDASEILSPVHQVRPGLSHALVMHGMDDRLTPYENATRFTAALRAAGTSVRLVSLPGVGHGFYVERRRDLYERTLSEIEEYLESLGLLEVE